MTKHVLCAVDLTHLETEVHILNRAAELARFYGADLSVVTVLPDYGMPIVASYFNEGAMKEAVRLAEQQLRDFVQNALHDSGSVSQIIEIGTAYEKILATIDETAADLVVMGAHKPELADRFQGPNSARVARHASCSVLIVRS